MVSNASNESESKKKRADGVWRPQRESLILEIKVPLFKGILAVREGRKAVVQRRY